MRCTHSALLRVFGAWMQVHPYRCRTWACPTCAPRLTKRLQKLAASGKPSVFLTLTVRVGAFETPDEAAAALVLAWRRCRQQLKRHHGKKRLVFFAVFEKTRQGWPHLHVLLRGARISQKWLSEYFRRRIDSPVVSIEKVQSQRHVARYVAKYVAKGPAPFRGRRRYFYSPAYPIEWERPKKSEADFWVVLTDPKAWLAVHFPGVEFDPQQDARSKPFPIGPPIIRAA